MDHVSQILENFPEKLKDILTYLFKTEKHIDISFETIPPLFLTHITSLVRFKLFAIHCFKHRRL